MLFFYNYLHSKVKGKTRICCEHVKTCKSNSEITSKMVTTQRNIIHLCNRHNWIQTSHSQGDFRVRFHAIPHMLIVCLQLHSFSRSLLHAGCTPRDFWVTGNKGSYFLSVPKTTVHKNKFYSGFMWCCFVGWGYAFKNVLQFCFMIV